MAPEYLSNLISRLLNRGYSLRSTRDNNKLLVPFTSKKTFASRSFAVYGPSKWNNLPVFFFFMILLHFSVVTLFIVRRL